jgi:hypothetical protein
MVISEYFIHGYSWLFMVIIFMVIGGYSINGCLWLLYLWLLMPILLVVVCGYYIYGYWCLFY